MGCGTSRPQTARSWMAVDGWTNDKKDMDALSDGGQDAEEYEYDSDGMIVVKDAAKTREKTVEASKYDEPQNREFKDGMLGVSKSEQIQKKISNLGTKQTFYDTDFPADISALYFSDREDPGYKWMSPQQLNKKPRVLVDGLSKEDIMQGILGDCWFLSSCAAIAQNSKLMSKVVPEQSNLYGDEYKGAVRFRFWRFGHWVDVWVDDLLPTKNGRLIYAKNTEPSEFWVALIEKAYAKLHGSYEAIEGGQAMDALVDLTGGLAERYELADYTYELYHKLAKANASGSFITCSRKGDWRADHNTVDEFGLIAGHAYSVTDVKRIKRKNGAECLLRIRNPWGMGEEWKGAWCDNDARWNLIDQETKKWLNFVEKEDGEFWMSYKDFVRHFQEVTICNLGPDFDGDGEVDEAGKMVSLHGNWVVGESAGGCRNDLYAFQTNPQYLLTVHEPDEGEDWMEEADETCSVLIALMQEHRRSQRHIGMKMLQIGFLIYATEESDERLTFNDFAYNYETYKSGVYVNFREVVGRFEMEPGQYIIIPTTYNKDEPGSFLLRCFAAKNISVVEMKAYEPVHNDDATDTLSIRDTPESVIPPSVIIFIPYCSQVVNTPSPNYPRVQDDFDPEIAAAMQNDLDDRKTITAH